MATMARSADELNSPRDDPREQQKELEQMTDEIKNSPVKGYTDQSAAKVALVNEYKILEERLLRELDLLEHFKRGDIAYDPRWVRIAHTHFQEGFMALNRAVFQPQRISLPEDNGQAISGNTQSQHT